MRSTIILKRQTIILTIKQRFQQEKQWSQLGKTIIFNKINKHYQKNNDSKEKNNHFNTKAIILIRKTIMFNEKHHHFNKNNDHFNEKNYHNWFEKQQCLIRNKSVQKESWIRKQTV